MAALNRSLYSGLCFQSSPRSKDDNDSNGSSEIHSKSSKIWILNIYILILQILIKEKNIQDKKREKTMIPTAMTPGWRRFLGPQLQK